ncbi:MAG: hypothetical protein QXT01_05585 [Sulfolobales archaeon]
MSIVIPLLISFTPALTTLTLIARGDVRLWLIALLGGGGWILALLLRQPLLIMLTGIGPSYIYVASFLAGLFEECLRLVLLRINFVSRSLLKGSLSLGLGWGLSEALNIYTIPALITATLMGYSWLDLLPGAVERNSATLLHVSLSLLLSKNARDLRLLFAAIFLHTLLNVIGVTSLLMLKDVWLVEGLIALTSLLIFTSIAFSILRLKDLKSTKHK